MVAEIGVAVVVGVTVAAAGRTVVAEVCTTVVPPFTMVETGVLLGVGRR